MGLERVQVKKVQSPDDEIIEFEPNDIIVDPDPSGNTTLGDHMADTDLHKNELTQKKEMLALSLIGPADHDVGGEEHRQSTLADFNAKISDGDFEDVTTLESTMDSKDTAAVSTHSGEADPHIQYQKESEKGNANGYASLDGAGLLPLAQLPLESMTYLGTWNATTNIPALADGVGNPGDRYDVGVAGTQDLGSGPIVFAQGDHNQYNGTIWQQMDNNESVTSVHGRVGPIVKVAGDYDHADIGNVIAGQHHAKYLDSEAVTAMGVIGDANPLNHNRPVQATESAIGLAEIATQAETNTGTDDIKMVTPLKLQNKITPHAEMYMYEAAQVVQNNLAGEYHGIVGFQVGSLDGFTFEVAGNVNTGFLSAGAGGSMNLARIGHGLVTGDFVSFTSPNNGSGLFRVTWIDNDNFTIPTPFGVPEFGNYIHASYLEVNSGSDGLFLFNYSISGESINAPRTYKFEGVLNDGEIDTVATERVYANNDMGVQSSSGVVALVAGDRIWMIARNSGNGAYTIEHSNVNLHRI